MSGPATEDRTPTCPVCGAGLTERDGGGWRCPVCAGAWLAAPGRPGPFAEGGRREEGLAPTPESPSPEGGARLRCIPEEIDFGVVRADVPRERTLRIESTGASPLSGELTVVDPFGVFRVSATTFAATPAEVRVIANADGLNPGAKRETCVCVRAGELKADVRALLEVGQPWPALLRSPRVLAAGAFVLVLFVLGSVYLPGWLAEQPAAPAAPLAPSKPQPPVVPTPPPGPPVPQRDPTGTVEWAGMTTVAEAEDAPGTFRRRFRADEGPLRYSVSLSNVRPGVQFEMVWYRGGQTIGAPPVFAADRSNPKGWSTYSGELVPGDYEVRLLANGSVKHRAAFEVVAAPLEYPGGWVPGEKPLSLGRTAHVSARELNVRSGPGTDHSVIAKLTRDTPVRVEAREVAPDGGSWVKVSADLVQGWVNERLLTGKRQGQSARNDPCPDDPLEWAQARDADTVWAYREYLRRCWPAQNAMEARTRIDILSEDAARSPQAEPAEVLLIRRVQEGLQELGEWKVEISGQLDAETRAAIRRFQSSKHYRGRFVDEQVSEQLLEDIRRAIRQRSDPTVRPPPPPEPEPTPPVKPDKRNPAPNTKPRDSTPPQSPRRKVEEPARPLYTPEEQRAVKQFNDM